MSESIDLAAEAAAVAARSHSPYSRFPVGAALRTVAGEVFSGCNVENASYPEGWCAETSAIAQMVSTAGPDARIAEIVTHAPAGLDGTPGTPCGGCRQRIREFSTAATVIRSVTPAGAELVVTVDELLPHSFGPERLL